MIDDERFQRHTHPERLHPPSRQGTEVIDFPEYSRSEYRADRCLHILGVTAGTIAVAILTAVALQKGGTLLIFSLALYGVGLLAMLGCSALYNMAGPSPRKEWFRRLDHAAIFVMIAGTYTPFTLIELGGAPGWRLFALVWMAAAAGAAMKLFFPRRLERVSVALYLLFGWGILAASDTLLAALPAPAILLLAAGGLVYSIGVLFHLRRGWPYHNAVWHALVLVAAGCHYAAILAYVASTP